MSKPPLEDVFKSAIGIETEGCTHQLFFYYPDRGGIQVLIKALEGSIVLGAITMNFEIRKITNKKKTWRVSDGVGVRSAKPGSYSRGAVLWHLTAHFCVTRGFISVKVLDLGCGNKNVIRPDA